MSMVFPETLDFWETPSGNSIVVDVMMGIFRNLLLTDEGTNGQLTLL